jgi:hypothetical protein
MIQKNNIFIAYYYPEDESELENLYIFKYTVYKYNIALPFYF